MSKKAIELIRVSTEGQAADDRGGIPAQRAANLRTAAVHGLQIVRTFQIEDVSGSRVLASPEMQQLLQAIKLPEIVGVVAKEFSRLMRPEDLGDFAILQQFIETKTVLYLPDGVVDLGNKSGKLFGGIRALMAGYEREEIRERMESGKEAIRRAGRHAGGSNTLPYGVAWDRQQGWSYTPEAEKVKEAFRQVLTTARPYAEIAAELGLPRTNLRYILQNPIWIGDRVYSKKRDLTTGGYIPGIDGRHGYRKKIERDPEEVIRVRVLPGIISERDFHLVQAILADRAARQRQVRSENAPRFQLNGYLSCALCGHTLYGHSNQKAHYYYCKLNNTRARQKGLGCRNPYILATKTEAKIDEVLSERLQERSALANIADKYFRRLQEGPAVSRMDVDASRALIASLEAKRARILDAFFEGAINKPERDKRLKAVDAELVGCRAMVVTGLEEQKPRMTAQQLADMLEVFAGFRFLSREEKRQILTAARARVFMDGYTIERLEIAAPFEASPTFLAPPLAGGSSYIDSRWKTAAIVTTPKIVIPVGW